MSTLTKNQQQTLLTFVNGNPTALAFKQAGDTVGLLAFLNLAASPVVLAWIVGQSPQATDEAVSSYTGFDALTQGKRDEWNIFLLFPRDYSKNKIRAVVTDVWGNATAGSVAESILQGATTPATNAQNAIGGNVRTTGTVSAMSRNYTDLCDTDDANFLINN